MKRFPVPKEAPTHYVRDLHVWIGLDVETPERFFDHLPWFTNVDRMSLLGYGGSPLLRSFWRLPESVTSLTIDTGVVSLVQVQDIMVQLPNLDNLSVSGSPAPVDGRGLTGIGSSLRGRFGGRLVLADGYVDPDVTNMLLEVPSGLRFTEVQVYCTRERLLPAVRVVEACGKTLTKLSHMVNSRKSQSLLLVQLVLMHETSTLTPFSDIDCRKTFERSFNFEPSFNFSKIPNLQEVTFSLRVNRMGGDLPWIHTALSTLRPATSPCLPAICLDFGCLSRPALDLPVEVLMKNMGDDLRRTADEVARIERQSEGAVNFTVLRDPVFEVVLDTLNVRFCLRGVDCFVINYFPQLLQQYKPCRASP